MEPLLDLLMAMAHKEPGVDRDPVFREWERELKLSLVLIGRHETMRRGGPWPYLTYIRRSLKAGIDTFYLLAAGRPNTSIARAVSKTIASQGKLVEVATFEHERRVDSTTTPEIVICLERPGTT